MKKYGVCFLFLLLFIVPLTLAANNETDSNKIALAYSCLQSAISNKTSSSPPSLQEATFTVLALGSNTISQKKIEDEKRTSSNTACWPKNGCTIKDTAQALLAYRQLGKDTKPIQNYLLQNTGPAQGLNWFLEVDIESHTAASCTATYSGSNYNLEVGNDMKLSTSGLGGCLSLSPSGYWLQVDNSCLGTAYKVSCDQDFVTSLLYQKTDSDTIYVSKDAHAAVSSGFTTENISSSCFKSGSTCDYEGSLWAAFALAQDNKNINAYVPYLSAAASDNEKFLPEAFLYTLNNGQDYYTALIEGQINNQYWSAPGSTHNKFYDTSLALLALQGKQAAQADKARTYLLGAQGSNGCWNNNNLFDTAFILYAGWPTQTPSSSSGGSIESCEVASAAYSCQSSSLVCGTAGGQVLSNYDCPGSLLCCSVKVVQQSCAQKNGLLCSLGQQCSGTTVDSADGSCCIGGICQTTAPQVDACQQSDGVCRASCNGDTEEQGPELCTNTAQLCCHAQTSTTSSEGPNTFLIVVLFLLVILVALAIVFRKRLQLLLFKSKRTTPGVSSSPITMRRPPFPPSMSPTYPPRQQSQPVRRSAPPVDKEMEETLRKLREMSK